MPAIDNHISREVWVATENLDKVKGAIEKLKRKALRHNLPSPTLDVTDSTRIDQVDVFEDGELVAKDFKVNKTKIVISGEFPRFSDYQFLAKIDHTVSKDQNVVLTPGGTFETELQKTGVDFHTCSSGCDHCGTNRDRNETFVVKNVKNNKVLQVGSSCVDDYVGTKTLPQLMAAFDINAIVYDVTFFDDMDQAYARGRQKNSVEARLLLAIAIEDIDNAGFRPSKSEYPTWHHVLKVLNSDRNIDYVGDEKGVVKAHNEKQNHPSLDKADKVIDWMMSLDPKSSDSTFIKNMQVVLGTGVIGVDQNSIKYVAMVSSLPNSFNRAMGERLTRGKSLNESFGEVKKRGRLKLTVLKVQESDAYAEFASTKVAMVDSEGRRFSWKASGYGVDVKVGQTYLLTGTIKSHSEFKGVNYTHLSRCSDFESAQPETPIPDFSAKIKPASKPKISLDESIYNFGFNPSDLDYKLRLSRTWKEGRSRFDFDFSISINEELTFEQLKEEYIEGLSLEGSVHMLGMAKQGTDPAMEKLKDVFDKYKALYDYPSEVVGRVVQSSEFNAFAVDHRKEFPNINDMFRAVTILDEGDVGKFELSAHDASTKVMDVRHTSGKTLGITREDFEQLGSNVYPLSNLLSNLADKGYDRIVVSEGYTREVFVPAVNGTSKLAPANIEILSRSMRVSNDHAASLKTISEQGKKVVFLSSDKPVEFNSLSIAMMGQSLKNGNDDLILMPQITAEQGSINDCLERMISELEALNNTEAEVAAVFGGYPDMPALLKSTGLNVKHIHISHEDGRLTPYFDQHAAKADMKINVRDGVVLANLLKSKVDDVVAMVKSPAVDIERKLSFEEAGLLVRGFEDLFDLEQSSISSWRGREVHRVTSELINDVVCSVVGKTPQAAFDALFTFSDAASDYAIKFAKDKLGVQLEVSKPTVDIKQPLKEHKEPTVGVQRKMDF